jgi:predicted nucleic acid-binding protein
MYLLDTNIISELRKPKPHGGVLAWMETVSDAEIYLSAVTLGEIQAGIEITRERDKGKAEVIERWALQLIDTQKILPMTAGTFRIWAKLMHKQSNTLYEDAMITATALEHKLMVVTRNLKDFEQFPVKCINPFDFKSIENL